MTKVSIYGMRKREYTFDVKLLKSYMPNCSGVYVFLKKHPLKPSYDILYIGETESFYNRVYIDLEQHKAWNCALRNGITHIAILAVSGTRQNRVDIETDLKYFNSTICNLQ